MIDGSKRLVAVRCAAIFCTRCAFCHLFSRYRIVRGIKQHLAKWPLAVTVGMVWRALPAARREQKRLLGYLALARLEHRGDNAQKRRAAGKGGGCGAVASVGLTSPVSAYAQRSSASSFAQLRGGNAAQFRQVEQAGVPFL